MPKYYCDYCDAFLTHDSPSVRKTHNGGRKHKENVRMYYQAWMEEQAQKLIDATTRAFTSQRMLNPGFAAPPGIPIVPRAMGIIRPPIMPPGAMGGFFTPPVMMPGAAMAGTIPIPPNIQMPTAAPAANAGAASINESAGNMRTNIKIQPPEH